MGANEIAAKGGRNAMAKLESRIRELEIELGSLQSRTGDTYKSFQKAERRIKELQFQQDEDHKNSDRMSDLAGKLQRQPRPQPQRRPQKQQIRVNRHRRGYLQQLNQQVLTLLHQSP